MRRLIAKCDRCGLTRDSAQMKVGEAPVLDQHVELRWGRTIWPTVAPMQVGGDLCQECAKGLIECVKTWFLPLEDRVKPFPAPQAQEGA